MTKRQVQVTYEDLSTRFDKPLSDVAVELGVCMTFIKKACRKHGIKRWPFRKVQAQLHRFERQKIREEEQARMREMAAFATPLMGHPHAFLTQNGGLSFNPFLASVGQLPPNTQVLIQPAYAFQQGSISQGSSTATLSCSSTAESAPQFQRQFIKQEPAKITAFIESYNPLLQPATASVQEAAAKLSQGSVLEDCPDSPSYLSNSSAEEVVEMDLLNHLCGFDFGEELFAPDATEAALQPRAECYV